MGLKGGVSKTVKFSLALDAPIRKHRGCRSGTNRKIRIRTEVLNRERNDISREIIAARYRNSAVIPLLKSFSSPVWTSGALQASQTLSINRGEF